jgi:hypothetical protein
VLYFIINGSSMLTAFNYADQSDLWGNSEVFGQPEHYEEAMEAGKCLI